MLKHSISLTAILVCCVHNRRDVSQLSNVYNIGKGSIALEHNHSVNYDGFTIFKKKKDLSGSVYIT